MISDHLIKLETGQIFREASDQRRVYTCRFVTAGRVRAAGNRASGIIIEAEALRGAVAKGLFDNTASFIDHPGLFETPSLRNLVGVTQDAVWSEATQSVEGKIRLYNTPDAALLAALLDEVLADRQEGLPIPDIGLSLVFWPEWAPNQEGQDEQRIVAIRHVESVDYVFQPAAEGRVLAALSAARLHAGSAPPEGTARPGYQRCPRDLLEGGVNPMNDAQQDAPRPGSEAGLAPEEAARAAGSWLAAIAESAAQAMIASSGLPEASKARLAAMRFESAGQVHAAVEAERDYLARLAQDQVIAIGGQAPRSPHISAGLSSLEKIEAAFEALMLGQRPAHGIQPLTGVRELYHLLSGDYEMTGLFQAERVQFANVNSSTMANLVANVLNKVIVQEFQAYPRWWEPVVNEMDFASLQDVRWITLGGVGELPTVAEGAAYTELTWDDRYETSSFVKKGGYLGISLESIDKDDTARLRAAPRALAQAAWLTLAKAVSSIFTANSGVGPGLSDGLALFHASHGNLGNAALSLSAWDAARLAMRKQTELNSGERLGALVAPRFLLVPPDLEVAAVQILASEWDYSYALSSGVAAPVNVAAQGETRGERLRLARERVIVVDLWTEAGDWAAVADPRLYPTIGLGFRYGRQPEIFSVASPTAGLMFSNDTMPIKARFFFAVGPVDYRGLYKSNP